MDSRRWPGAMKRLEALVQARPPRLRREVMDSARFLLGPRGYSKRQRLSFRWAGKLKEPRDLLTSLGLAKKVGAWWGD
jgi:hypothetical protein